jgi:hypothetical protein
MKKKKNAVALPSLDQETSGSEVGDRLFLEF